ncbi:hypothetical protein PTTG_28629 [Puccinia triticina 1-1 BBBD Race 1]|uniref:Uncharacterized protein n=1 Tax=Puccinia triticina (isolate 1-1 / race 1 (BBBD)) TaxID=630390 RepID=A0A180GAP6_PUCT1|nr:hypothetical protein PTTG_28629 [Puccinia triticina 1-1 BBBD Race 1]WAR55639.1 hypothetical protein PtB15_6B382 [Puccinia triticina]
MLIKGSRVRAVKEVLKRKIATMDKQLRDNKEVMSLSSSESKWSIRAIGLSWSMGLFNTDNSEKAAGQDYSLVGILRVPIPLTCTQPELIGRVLPSNSLRSRPWSCLADSALKPNSSTFKPHEIRQAPDMIIDTKRLVLLSSPPRSPPQPNKPPSSPTTRSPLPPPFSGEKQTKGDQYLTQFSHLHTRRRPVQPGHRPRDCPPSFPLRPLRRDGGAC